ncbi:MAG TPA: ABC transporter permease subunit [Acidobacteria bacterium]|nr:ABC transporter permease subunit [Acidobacteriota bacterium]
MSQARATPRAPHAAPPGMAGKLALTTLVVLSLFLLSLIVALVRLAASDAGRPAAFSLASLLLTSLAAALAATALALAFGVPAALWLARHRFPGRTLLTTLLDLPTMLSPVAVGTALVLFLRDPPGAWLEGAGGFLFGFPGVVLAQFTVIVALVVRSAEAAFTDVDTRLERLAELHGATRRQVLTRITLPLARPGLLAAAVLAFARALGEFGATVTVAGTIPGRTETLSTGIFLALESGELAGAARLSLILVVVAGAMLLLLRKVVGWRR